jgi:alpha-N-acetylglucosamine transferase
MWTAIDIQSRFAEQTCLTSEPVTPPSLAELDIDSADIPWGDYAYAQYATDQDYLCNSVMIFAALHRFKSKASRFLIYPASWTDDDTVASVESHLLNKAKNDYNVELVPVTLSQKDQDFSLSRCCCLIAFKMLIQLQILGHPHLLNSSPSTKHNIRG